MAECWGGKPSSPILSLPSCSSPSFRYRLDLLPFSLVNMVVLELMLMEVGEVEKGVEGSGGGRGLSFTNWWT